MAAAQDEAVRLFPGEDVACREDVVWCGSGRREEGSGGPDPIPAQPHALLGLRDAGTRGEECPKSHLARIVLCFRILVIGCVIRKPRNVLVTNLKCAPGGRITLMLRHYSGLELLDPFAKETDMLK